MWSLARWWTFFASGKNDQSHVGTKLSVCVSLCVWAHVWGCLDAGMLQVWAKWDKRQAVWWLGHFTKLYGPQMCESSEKGQNMR